MNSIVVAVLFFFAVASAQQCVYNRMETFYSTQATQSLTIEHDFGTSADIEFVKGDNLGIVLVASVEDPTLLLPSVLSFSFSETNNTSRLVIKHDFSNNNGGGAVLSDSARYAPSVTILAFALVAGVFKRNYVALGLVFLFFSFALAETGCRTLSVQVTVPPSLLEICENGSCQNLTSSQITPVYDSCSVSEYRFEPVGPNMFTDFTAEEYDAIRNFLHSKKELNLTAYAEADLFSNYIYSIENYLPPKADVLNYLDKNGPAPSRFARAVLYRGAANPPDVRELLIPYPFNGTYSVITIYENGSIPFLMRTPDTIEYDLYDAFLLQEIKVLDKLMNESFGTNYGNCNEYGYCLTWTDTAPRGKDRTERQTWSWFLFDIEGKYLHPIGFEFLINHKSQDPSQWSIGGVSYNGQLFADFYELAEAYENDNVTKVVHHGPVPGSIDQLRTTYNKIGDERPGERKTPPRHYEPQGKRFNITGNHIDYLGWSFHIGTRPSTGLQFYDINFKGERIIYEMGLQDSTAQYTGSRPVIQSITNYMDNGWDMGRSMYELKHGVDCPYTATYLNYTFYSEETAYTIRNAICIFERDDAIPLRRHYDNGDPYIFYGGVASYSLVVRTCNAVYNYDYIYDHIFYLNGAMELKVSTSGYLQAAPWFDSETPYGAQLGIHTMGSLHDHIIGYKIDLDIAGVENRFERTDISVEQVDYPWAPVSPWFNKRVDRRFVADETDSTVMWDMNHPALMAFVSGNSTNRWGYRRGYKININGMIKNLIADHPVGNSMQWGKYNAAVTKRKETEPRSATPYDQTCNFEPVVKFDDFLDGDNLMDEDLVLWAAVGVFHLPHAEDFPNTATTGNGGSIWLRPYNFFDQDPSLDLVNQVLIKPDGNGGNIVDAHGQEYEVCIPSETDIEYYGAVDSL